MGHASIASKCTHIGSIRANGAVLCEDRCLRVLDEQAPSGRGRSLTQRSNDAWGPVQLLLRVRACTEAHEHVLACGRGSVLCDVKQVCLRARIVWVEKMYQLSEIIKPTLQQPNEQGPVADMGRYAHQWLQLAVWHCFWHGPQTDEFCRARRLARRLQPQEASLRHLTLHMTTCACHTHNRARGFVWPLGAGSINGF
jgi:hypothetical protein